MGIHREGVMGDLECQAQDYRNMDKEILESLSQPMLEVCESEQAICY